MKRNADDWGQMPPPRPKVPTSGAQAKPHAHPSVAPNAVVEATRARNLNLQYKSDANRKADRVQMKSRMNYLLKEIDTATGHPISGCQSPIQFLDTCCAPGGFCEYTLAFATGSRGLGFSLDPKLGGHTPEIPFDSPRFHLQYADATEIANGLRCQDMMSGTVAPRDAYRTDAGPDDPPTRVVDLIILDGSFLGGKEWITKETHVTDEANPVFNCYKDKSESHLALLVAQLMVMGNNLRENGTMLLRLSMHPDAFVCGLLCMLRRLFEGTIINYKPRSMHTCATSYYVVAKGFKPELLEGFKWNERLGSLLSELKAGKAKPMFVPFPGLEESTDEGLRITWSPSLRAYHGPLKRFMQNIERAIQDKERLDRAHGETARSRKGRFIEICNGYTLRGRCDKMNCPQAHSFRELHPLVQQAFMEPLGRMHRPGEVPEEELRFVDMQEGISYGAQDAAQAAVMANYHRGQQGMEGANDEQYNGVDGFETQWEMGLAPGMPQLPSLWQPHNLHDQHPATLAQRILNDDMMGFAAFGMPSMMQSMLGNGGGMGFLPCMPQISSRAGPGMFAAGNMWGGLPTRTGSMMPLNGHAQGGRQGSLTGVGESSLVPAIQRIGSATGPVDLLGDPVGGVGFAGDGCGEKPTHEQEEKGEVVAMSGYEKDGVKVMVTADRAALQAVLHFLNG